MDMFDKFVEDMNEDSDNWKLRSVIADWFEDNNQLAKAECFRWSVLNNKRPCRNGGSKPAATYAWFNKDTISAGMTDPESDIPGKLYDCLPGKSTANHKSYDTLREAEEALIEAYKLAVAKGWNPNVQ